MKAAVLYSPRRLRIEDRPVPRPHAGWVVLAVEAAGICGTDVAVYEGRHPAKMPLVLGHEFAGRVLSVGEEVYGLHPGQRVMGQGGWACGSCRSCISSQFGNCASRVLLGRTVDGCFADAITVPSKTVHPLPDAISAHEAQSITTLATALHAAGRVRNLRHARIAIVGAGHAGLILLQVCRAFGAGEIVVIGTRDNRLALAATLGASRTTNIRTVSFEDWKEDAGNHDFDVSFEASGTAVGLAQTFRLTRSGGTVVAYGIIDSTLDTVPGIELYARELTVLGSRGAGGHYQDAIGMLAAGKIQIEPLITHRMLLEDAVFGFSLMTRKIDNVVRVVFHQDTFR